MRNIVLWGVLVLILVVVNGQIIGKERVLARGEIMLLELAPRDPRSLLQGDYMALRYRLARKVGRRFSKVASLDGHAVVRLDEHGVARFVRIYDAAQGLQGEEKLLFFRKRGESVRLAGDAFFFQEGQGERYQNARYGELRVDDEGNAVLVGLRDGQLQALPDDEPGQTR